MKKHRSIQIVCCMLAVILTAAAVGSACGKNYTKYFDYFGTSFSWDMDVSKAERFIASRQLFPKEIEVDDYDTWASVSDGDYVIRISKETNEVEMIKHIMGYDPGMINQFKEWYGEPNGIKGKDQYAYYVWYGMMAGRKTELQVPLYESSGKLHVCFVLRG